MAKHSENEQDFKILLNTVVIEVKQSEHDENEPVEIVTQDSITGEKRVFRARKVISSLPINQYQKVKFTPDLPYFKRNLFKFYQVGNYMKYIGNL